MKKIRRLLVLQEFTDVSGRKVKADETHKEQFIQDYIAAAGYADAAFKKETKAKTKELLKSCQRQHRCIFH